VRRGTYHPFINRIKAVALPKNGINGSLVEDLKLRPVEYLRCMVRMMKEIEENEEECKLPNVIPQRTHLTPCSIRIETEILTKKLLEDSFFKKKDQSHFGATTAVRSRTIFGVASSKQAISASSPLRMSRISPTKSSLREKPTHSTI
jgi:hypothetical protein